MGPTTRKIILIIITIIYIAIAIIIIKRYGAKWIPIVWSFPLFTLSVLILLERNPKEKLCNENLYLFYFLIAYVILSASLLAAYIIAGKYKKRRLAIMLSFLVWGGLSLIHLNSKTFTHPQRDKLIL